MQRDWASEGALGPHIYAEVRREVGVPLQTQATRKQGINDML